MGGLLTCNVLPMKSPMQVLPKEDAPNSAGQKRGHTGRSSFEDYINENLNQARARQMHVNLDGMIALIDLLVRKFTGQKHVSTQVRNIPEEEAREYAHIIVQKCKKMIGRASSKSNISRHRLKIDSIEQRMLEEITGKIMSGKIDEITGIVDLYVEKACPGREVGCSGRLSPKKFDKFMTILNNGINTLLCQLVSQILNDKNNVLGVKEQQEILEPKSYLDNVSVSGHLTKVRGLR